MSVQLRECGDGSATLLLQDAIRRLDVLLVGIEGGALQLRDETYEGEAVNGEVITPHCHTTSRQSMNAQLKIKIQ